MIRPLDKKYTRFEASRKALLTDLAQLKKAQLHASSGENEWNITQVLAHLLNAETLSLHYIKKKLQEEKSLQETSLRNRFNSILLKLLLRSGLKFKAPAVVAAVPSNPDFEEVNLQWDSTRKELKELLESITPQLLNKNVFKHPTIGYLNIVQALDFLQAHFDHHLPQIKRLKK